MYLTICKIIHRLSSIGRITSSQKLIDANITTHKGCLDELTSIVYFAHLFVLTLQMMVPQHLDYYSESDTFCSYNDCLYALVIFLHSYLYYCKSKIYL